MTTDGSDTSRNGYDPIGVWAAADWSEESEWENAEDPAALLRSQRAWARAIEFDFPADGDITCDPWTFLPLRETQFIAVGVTGPAPRLTQIALSAAAHRMTGVLPDGREVDPDEVDDLWDELDDDADEDDLYTVNYISDPEQVGDIVGISNIDTKGSRFPWMFRTFLRIISEELRAAGGAPARIIPFLTPESSAWLTERGERYPSPEELH